MKSQSCVVIVAPVFALALGTMLGACSNLEAGSKAASAGAAVSLSSSELFAKIAALPQTGAGSVASLYTRIGSMSFSEYYHYLDTTAADVDVQVDSYALGNAKTALEAHASTFRNAAVLFPTVGEWWQAIGFKPTQLASASELKLSLGQAFGHALEIGLTDGASSSTAAGKQNLILGGSLAGGLLNGLGNDESCGELLDDRGELGGAMIAYECESNAAIETARKDSALNGISLSVPMVGQKGLNYWPYTNPQSSWVIPSRPKPRPARPSYIPQTTLNTPDNAD